MHGFLDISDPRLADSMDEEPAAGTDNVSIVLVCWSHIHRAFQNDNCGKKWSIWKHQCSSSHTWQFPLQLYDDDPSKPLLTFLPCLGCTPAHPQRRSPAPQGFQCHWSHYKEPMGKTHRRPQSWVSMADTGRYTAEHIGTVTAALTHWLLGPSEQKATWKSHSGPGACSHTLTLSQSGSFSDWKSSHRLRLQVSNLPRSQLHTTRRGQRH